MIAEYTAAALDVVLSVAGETIRYKPAGGAERTMLAIVRRVEEIDAVAGPSGGMAPRIEVTVAADASSGILPSEVNCGGDLVSVPVRSGEPARDLAVCRILADHTESLTLELR